MEFNVTGSEGSHGEKDLPSRHLAPWLTRWLFHPLLHAGLSRRSKTTVTPLLRCSWQAVADVLARAVAEAIDGARLDEVYRIGVDEVVYRKGHRYLTIVADHDRDGAIIWAGEGKSAVTLKGFYDEVGEQRCANSRPCRWT